MRLIIPLKKSMNKILWIHQPKDDRFISLYKQVILGEIPYYHCMIKSEAIRPFSSFVPGIPKEFEQYILRKLNEGEIPSIHVYPDKDLFIMSDDYFLYYYYLHINVNKLPCFCLGIPEGKAVIKKRLVEVSKLPPMETVRL